MKPEFPNRFSLASLPGYRAKSFSKREDAFQQLVGEALQLASGFRAHVTGTKGRDGSIDAWVETSVLNPSPFSGMPGPIIVECKDHDDNLSNSTKNILSGWRQVEQKLQIQSRKAWSGLFAPWKNARSYAYLVSAILHQAGRNDLTELIQKFFASLPEDCRPPLETIRVLDWSDLRPWLGSITRISDAWLGTGSPSVLTQTEYIASLSGFREYLLSSKLPFVPPETASPLSPEALFDILDHETDKPGVVLVGAGGVGKTRTSLETARLAEQAGWRVLHIVPAESLTNEDLARVVLLSSQASILVFDYVDQLQWLDFGWLRRSLIPQAQQRGIRIKFFANCRPGWMRLNDPDLDELFERVDLQPDVEHRNRIIHKIIAHAAPRCLNHFGKKELVRICGHRPIIALLIARELEHRFGTGQSDELELAGLRTGNLLRWLRKRLADDGMKVDLPTSPLEQGRPSVAVVTATAALVCAPSSVDTLIGAGRKAARTLGEPCNSEHVVAALTSLGWLEKEGSQVVASHDVIVDEIFDQVVRKGAFVREAELAAILSVWSVSTEMIGRLAAALKRVFGAIEDDLAAQHLKEAAALWLENNAVSIGRYLASSNASLASSALGAVLDSPPWSRVASKRWSELVSPWLTKHGETAGAYRLLHKGLRQVDSMDKLLDWSLAWLHKFSERLEAQFVLGPLLNREELDGRATEIVQLGLSWLKRFPNRLEAQFVLAPLLRRENLGHDTTNTIKVALSWLRRFPKKLETQFVLVPLLGREDLEYTAPEVIRLALDWLKNYRRRPDASFVLVPLLERQDLGQRAGEVIELAHAWLKKSRNSIDAAFVLGRLLKRQDLGDRAAEVSALAKVWLKKFSGRFQARFILGPLLRQEGLADKEDEPIKVALAWLHKYPDKLGTGYMLGPLLGRQDLGGRAKEVNELALSWLGMFPGDLDAGFVLVPLLRRKDLGDKSHEAIKLALAWLHRFGHRRAAVYLLGPLLARQDLGDMTTEASELALTWLKKFPDSLDASFVLAPLLQQHESGEGASQAIEHALTWITGERKAANYVFNRILRSPVASPDQWDHAANAAFLWLRQTPVTVPDRDHTINSLLKRYEALKSDDLDFLIREAILWLKNNRSDKHVERVQISLRRAKRVLAPGPLHREIEDLDPYGKFVLSLEQRVHDRTLRLEDQQFHLACLQVENEARKSPQSAAFAIPFLLALGCRLGHDALDEARRVADIILKHKSMSKVNLEKLAIVCWGLLKQTVFANHDQAIEYFSRSWGSRNP